MRAITSTLIVLLAVGFPSEASGQRESEGGDHSSRELWRVPVLIGAGGAAGFVAFQAFSEPAASLTASIGTVTLVVVIAEHLTGDSGSVTSTLAGAFVGTLLGLGISQMVSDNESDASVVVVTVSQASLAALFSLVSRS